jgi:hypothetical protein
VNRFSYYHILMLIAIVLLVRASVEAQVGRTSVTLKGTVSETIALSILPSSTNGNIHREAAASGSTMRITLKGTDAKSPVIRVPLILRSNSSFRISATVEAKAGELTQMSVIDVRSTGSMVSPGVIGDLKVPPELDGRGLDESAPSATSPLPLDISRPLLVLSGPRISLGGRLDSSNNALQITLLIHVNPHPTRGWLIDLTFSGSTINIL